MRIVCIGGGPAGLYFAVCAKLRDPRCEVVLLERNPPDTAHGWGVTFGDALLDRMYRKDRPSAQALERRAVVWQGLHMRLYGGRRATERGYGYAIARDALLRVLTDRAIQLGVDVRHGTSADPAHHADVDLIVAADGANSSIRRAASDQFGTESRWGANYFAWLGSEHAFDGLTFVLAHTSAGLVWMHAYPTDAGTSSCVVECGPATWQALGGGDPGPSTDVLSEVFRDVLGGRTLLDRGGSQPCWQRFLQIRNAHWYHGNVVLVGDAAHTTHFSLGAGTAEAIADAAVLAASLDRHAPLAEALAAYQERRQRSTDRVQRAAAGSMATYEQMDRFADREALQLAAVLAGGDEGPAKVGVLARFGQNPLAQGFGRRRDVAIRRRLADRRERMAGKK